MHIVSYRGPGKAGGVSAALARAWDSNLGSGGLWWHLNDNDLKVSSDPHSRAVEVATLPAEIIQGHYRFCNEFLWPVMHDLPEHAHLVPEDRAYYDTFNETLGWCIVRAHTDDLPGDFFVQDYQLALIPQFLRENAGFRAVVFWHIPWPKHVRAEHVDNIRAIARGLLSAEAIGFHTQEYAENFFNFVEQYLPEFGGSRENLAIWSGEPVNKTIPSRWSVGKRARSLPHNAMYASKRITRLLVAPLGIDYDYWAKLSARQQNTIWHPALVRTPFILSVDRADYTKDVVGRIQAIDLLLDRHPEWQGRIVFAQVCGKTRSGLDSFDQYWGECQQAYDRLTERWSDDHWHPLMWIEQSFSAAELALAYRTAAAMLVNPVRDGLNLTAKEYVACQGQRPGVLALSNGAGAWQELGSHAVALQAGNPSQMADAIHQALVMDSHERSWRMSMLKERVRNNTLSRWWYTFASLLDGRAAVTVPNLGLLKETS